MNEGRYAPVLALLVTLPSVAAAQVCSIQIESVATLGDLSDPASVEIPSEADVAHVPWGGWLVTEDGNRILEYSEDGSFRRFFGSRGEGPGELLYPNAVAVDETDSVWISHTRGRAVIFGPDGEPGRTMVDPDLHRVSGFTSSGLPFNVLALVDMTGNEPPTLFAQVWDREGRPSHRIGPAAVMPIPGGVVTNFHPPPQSVATLDTVLFTPLFGLRTWSGWLWRWTPSAVDTLASAASVWDALGLNDGARAEERGRPVAVAAAEDGFWVLGAVRRLSEDDEGQLSEAAPLPRGETLERFRSEYPSVRNAVFDGALVHVSEAGVVREGVTFNEYPMGFSDSDQFYTFAVDEAGLITIRIWRFGRECS